MRHVVYAVIRIEYESEDKFYTKEETDLTAINLVVNPSYHTTKCGVSLNSVQLDVVDKDHLIDWDKLKHDPDEIFIDQ